jgi:hypothetical protein
VRCSTKRATIFPGSHLPVAASKMRAVLSHDGVTMRDPSGLNAGEFWNGPDTSAISRAVAVSQMRAVISDEAVRMRDPSGLNATNLTELKWPRRTAISRAVAASQMRAVLSSEAVTIRDPSWLKTTARRGARMCCGSSALSCGR